MLQEEEYTFYQETQCQRPLGWVGQCSNRDLELKSELPLAEVSEDRGVEGLDFQKAHGHLKVSLDGVGAIQ